MKHLWLTLCILTSFSLFPGCAPVVADRYQYSCTLGEAEMQQYGAWFTGAFRHYSLESHVGDCEEGLARGLLFRAPGKASLPSESALRAAGCTRYADPQGLEPNVYTCHDGSLRVEITFEDDTAYVYPLES